VWWRGVSRVVWTCGHDIMLFFCSFCCIFCKYITPISSSVILWWQRLWLTCLIYCVYSSVGDITPFFRSSEWCAQFDTWSISSSDKAVHVYLLFSLTQLLKLVAWSPDHFDIGEWEGLLTSVLTSVSYCYRIFNSGLCSYSSGLTVGTVVKSALHILRLSFSIWF